MAKNTKLIINLLSQQTLEIFVSLPQAAAIIYQPYLENSLSIIAQLLEQDAILQLNRNNILEVFASHLGEFFDNLIGIFINEDSRFRGTLGNYIQTNAPFDRYLTNKYPNLTTVITKTSTSFAKSIETLLRHISNDIEIIKNGFLADLNAEAITLEKISAAGSDLHRQGQQVFFLTFSDNHGAKKRIVYKPSPVLADALLVGDVQKLKQLDPHFGNDKSLVELINEDLEPPQQLGTYLIMPRLDRDCSGIAMHYGYIEFLSHEPGITFDLNDDQNVINRKIWRMLKEASRVPNCDYITDDLHAVQRYAKDCGRLCALLQMIGGTDIHLENLIIHQLRPYLIDLEICFTPSELSLRSTVAFDATHGAMRKDTMGLGLFFRFAADTNNVENAVTFLQKNRLFHYQRATNTLSACQPNKEDFIQGYVEILNVLKERLPDIERWFAQASQHQLPVRILPQCTANFVSEMKFVITKNPTEAFYIESMLQQANKLIEKEIKLKSEDSDRAFFTKIKHLPYYAVFYGSNSTSCIFNEYQCLSIPWYYTYITDTHLYDSNDEIVSVPVYEVTNPAILEFNITGTREAFFRNTPLHFIQKRLSSLLSTPNLLEELTSVISRNFDELTSETKTDHDRFVHVPLDETSYIMTEQTRNNISIEPRPTIAPQPRQHPNHPCEIQ